MVEINNVTVSMGSYLLKTLDLLKEFPKNDWDNVLFVTGREGDGKTTFVKLASYYLDQSVCADRWAYESGQFEQIVDSDLPDGANIIWDESDELAGHWADMIIRTITRKMKRIRKKHLTIWLITPTFFDMKKYFSIFRTRCLFDVYADPSLDDKGKFIANRGQVRFFNYDKKRELYFKGIKTWDMYAILPNFVDRFGKVPENYPIKEFELESKKDEAMKAIILRDKQPKVNENQIKFNVYQNIQAKLTSKPMYKWGLGDWAAVLDMSRPSFYDYRNRNKNLLPFDGDVLANDTVEGRTLPSELPSSESENKIGDGL